MKHKNKKYLITMTINCVVEEICSTENPPDDCDLNFEYLSTNNNEKITTESGFNIILN